MKVHLLVKAPLFHKNKLVLRLSKTELLARDKKHQMFQFCRHRERQNKLVSHQGRPDDISNILNNQTTFKELKIMYKQPLASDFNPFSEVF